MPDKRTPIRRETWPPKRLPDSAPEDPPRDEEHLFLDRPRVRIVHTADSDNSEGEPQ